MNDTIIVYKWKPIARYLFNKTIIILKINTCRNSCSNCYFDKQYFFESDVRLIINALYIFISKIDKEQGELFYNFDGFAPVSERDDLSLVYIFQNNLHIFRLEHLTLEDCLKIQELFDKLYLNDLKYGKVSKNVFDFIDNMVQMRIALEKYGDKTGYKISE